jgi:GDPmannose 4,6-dehydratase
VRTDPQFLRPADIDLLVGDARRASMTLGWQPRISFTEMVQEMVENDIETLKRCP